jgi:hypothetical protein
MDEEEDIPKIGLATKRGGAKVADEGVPKIGRGKLGFKLPIRQLFVIGMTLITLIVLLTMRKTCADGVGKAFNNIAPPPAPDAGTITYEKAPPLPPEETPTPTPPLRPIPSTPGR